MDPEEEDPPRFALRYFNISVRRLGYTHTEAGRRTLGQLTDEMTDLVAMEEEARRGTENMSWITMGGEEDTDG